MRRKISLSLVSPGRKELWAVENRLELAEGVGVPIGPCILPRGYWASGWEWAKEKAAPGTEWRQVGPGGCKVLRLQRGLSVLPPSSHEAQAVKAGCVLRRLWQNKSPW